MVCGEIVRNAYQDVTTNLPLAVAEIRKLNGCGDPAAGLF